MIFSQKENFQYVPCLFWNTCSRCFKIEGGKRLVDTNDYSVGLTGFKIFGLYNIVLCVGGGRGVWGCVCVCFFFYINTYCKPMDKVLEAADFQTRLHVSYLFTVWLIIFMDSLWCFHLINANKIIPDVTVQ